MLTAYGELVAREMGVSRRAEAEAAAMSTSIRLVARQRRLERRLERVQGRMRPDAFDR